MVRNFQEPGARNQEPGKQPFPYDILASFVKKMTRGIGMAVSLAPGSWFLAPEYG
jgi:hypothetical protein